jgi:hypothetical protein
MFYRIKGGFYEKGIISSRSIYVEFFAFCRITGRINWE